MTEEFYFDSSMDTIRDKFNRGGVTLEFTYYNKYCFYWNSTSDADFKITAMYGGNADYIYRYSINSGETRSFKTFNDLKNAFNSIEIHDYTNQLIYSYEDL